MFIIYVFCVTLYEEKQRSGFYMTNYQKIAVYDSGVGGLLVLEDLVKHFPNQDFIYLGDTLNNPYGTKTEEQLIGIIEKNLAYLEKQNVDAILIACNTASIAPIHMEPKVRVFRIVNQTIKRANVYSKPTLILATDYTISKQVYQNQIPSSIGVGCSCFVELVEKNLIHTPYAKELVYQKLKPYRGKAEAIILGCTHFGLLKDLIEEVLGDVIIIDSAHSLTPLLSSSQIINPDKDHKGHIVVQTTGEIEELNASWLSIKIDHYEKVVINDIRERKTLC